MSFFNPFDFVFETETQPHVRTLRTGSFQKIKDAFNVFSGTVYANQESNNAGLIGLATLFIPWIIEKLSFELFREIAFKHIPNVYNWDKPLLVRLMVIALLGLGAGITVFVAGTLSLIRYIAAAVLTLASLPIIGFISMISFLKSKHKKEILLNVQVNIITQGKKENSTKNISQKQILGRLLDSEDADLENLTYESVRKITGNSNPIFILKCGSKSLELELNKGIKKAVKKLNLGQFVAQKEKLLNQKVIRGNNPPQTLKSLLQNTGKSLKDLIFCEQSTIEKKVYVTSAQYNIERNLIFTFKFKDTDLTESIEFSTSDPKIQQLVKDFDVGQYATQQESAKAILLNAFITIDKNRTTLRQLLLDNQKRLEDLVFVHQNIDNNKIISFVFKFDGKTTLFTIDQSFDIEKALRLLDLGRYVSEQYHSSLANPIGNKY